MQHGYAGRISYLWGFTGPCIAIDTACSSGLVAIGTANHGMLLGLVPQALAGGVNLLLSAHTHAMFAVAGTQILGSWHKDCHVRPFATHQLKILSQLWLDDLIDGQLFAPACCINVMSAVAGQKKLLIISFC